MFLARIKKKVVSVQKHVLMKVKLFLLFRQSCLTVQKKERNGLPWIMWDVEWVISSFVAVHPELQAQFSS